MPDASNDPALLVLKGRAYLQNGKLEEAFQVHPVNTYRVSVLLAVCPGITNKNKKKKTTACFFKGVF